MANRSIIQWCLTGIIFWHYGKTFRKWTKNRRFIACEILMEREKKWQAFWRRITGRFPCIRQYMILRHTKILRILSHIQVNARYRCDGCRIERYWSLFYVTIVPTLLKTYPCWMPLIYRTLRSCDDDPLEQHCSLFYVWGTQVRPRQYLLMVLSYKRLYLIHRAWRQGASVGLLPLADWRIGFREPDVQFFGGKNIVKK